MPAIAEPIPAPALTPGDLAELIASFNEVTSRLERTHESLRLEVSRLQGELREANDQLERSRRLAALGEMAAGIAHEVRNPLGSIRLYARMLEQDLAGMRPQRSLATKIAAAVVGLDAVVGDVLSFARETRVHPEPVDGRDLLERAVEACIGAHQSEHPPRLEIRSTPEPLTCDPILMHGAIVNLIRNALEAMAEESPPPGGHILRVEARAGDGCLLSIADTGPGIPEDVIARMFNPFFTTRKTGTGLGLAIVHRIVDAHAGRITVRNRSREGSRTAAGVQDRGTTIELWWPPSTDNRNDPKAERQDGAVAAQEMPR